jgi:hypothetical protein
VLTLGVGDVFGGSSVLACATDRVAFLPGTKLGLSGPRLIEMAHGRSELDAADVAAVAALFGAEARAAKGEIELVADDAAIVRGWIASTLRDEVTFVERVQAMQVHLAKRLFASDVRRDAADARRVPAAVPAEGLFADARPVAPDASLWKVNERPIWLARPSAPRPVGPREAHALDADLLAHLASEASSAGATLILVEDSPGHEATAAAEALCVSQYLAQHAAVLALLRARGVRIIGLLTGSGHSAAFFVNALQAARVYAVPDARVVAMEPAAIARVTRLEPTQIAALVEDDPALGHPVRHFAGFGGIAEILPATDVARLLALVLRDG